MLRAVAVLAVFTGLHSPIQARMVSESARPDFGANAAQELPVRAEGAVPRLGKLQMTEETEIRCEGKACRLQDLPPGAEVEFMEIAHDRRTILKMHFRVPAPAGDNGAR